MKKRRPAPLNRELVETSRTGHHCPTTGWWTVPEDPRHARLITEGELMPALHGTPTLWILRETAGSHGFRPTADLIASS